jgi:HAE1 family hydrophobic/amphiphilic exporter-1
MFLAQQISQVPGVAQVSIFGDRTPSIRIQVDPAKLASSGVTLEEIRTALVSSTTNIAKGTINTSTKSFTIATNDQIVEAEPFNDVILAYRNGAPIRVRDVGRAVSAAVDRNVAAYQNNKDGIILAVFKQPGANVVDRRSDQGAVAQLTARIPPAVRFKRFWTGPRPSAPLSPTSNSRSVSPSLWWCW